MIKNITLLWVTNCRSYSGSNNVINNHKWFERIRQWPNSRPHHLHGESWVGIAQSGSWTTFEHCWIITNVLCYIVLALPKMWFRNILCLRLFLQGRISDPDIGMSRKQVGQPFFVLILENIWKKIIIKTGQEDVTYSVTSGNLLAEQIKFCFLGRSRTNQTPSPCKSMRIHSHSAAQYWHSIIIRHSNFSPHHF
jgi:hypothetical protein